MTRIFSFQVKGEAKIKKELQTLYLLIICLYLIYLRVFDKINKHISKRFI